MKKMTEQGTPSPCESCPEREFCGSVEHCESWRQWFAKRWDEIAEEEQHGTMV